MKGKEPSREERRGEGSRRRSGSDLGPFSKSISEYKGSIHFIALEIRFITSLIIKCNVPVVT